MTGPRSAGVVWVVARRMRGHGPVPSQQACGGSAEPGGLVGHPAAGEDR